MIFDGPKNFPNSVVEFTRFKNHETRQMFAYLRELEWLRQDELSKLTTEDELNEICSFIKRMEVERKPKTMKIILELLTIQKNLIWMCTNVTGSDEERAERRRGFGSNEHKRMSKLTFHWTKSAFHKLLNNFSS